MAKKRAEEAAPGMGELGDIFPEGTPGNLAVTTSRRMMLVARRYRKALDQALRDVGHSQARWEILFSLSMDEEASTLMQIAARIGLEGPSIVATMEKLEEGGFIERRKDANDRRSRLIRLTDKGRDAVRTMAEAANRQRATLLEGVATADLEAMLRALTQMRDNLWKRGIRWG